MHFYPPPVQENTNNQSVATSQSNNLNIVKNKAQWIVVPGVIAQRVTPSDFENLNNVSGINIQQGVSALIFIDGKKIAEINGGIYDFVTKDALDQLLAQKSTPGLTGHIKNFFQSIAKTITGKKVGDVIKENTNNNSSIKTLDDAIKHLRSDSHIDVYLKTDSCFKVILNTRKLPDGKIEFAPFKIPCKHLTADVAVTIKFRISDFNTFISNFMANKDVVTSRDIECLLSPQISTILSNCLRDVEITEYGIPSNSVRAIENTIAQTISLPGLSMERGIEITLSNEDFKRLRKIADELYVSEKELSFAIRTNDFRNRLDGIENDQRIKEARTALDLHKALTEINKDGALHEDELDEFYMLLSRQKKIREASNEQEIKSALDDIKKTNLIGDDEMEALEIELLTKKNDRMAVAEIMAIQNMANIEIKRMEIENLTLGQKHSIERTKLSNAHELDVDKVLNECEIDDILTDHTRKNSLKEQALNLNKIQNEVEQKRMLDIYEDEQHKRKLNQSLSEANAQLDIEERKRRMVAEELERLNKQNMSIFEMWANEDERKAQNDHIRTI